MTRGLIDFSEDWSRTLLRDLDGRRALVIASKEVVKTVGVDFDSSIQILEVPDGEAQKSWKVVSSLTSELEEISFPRDGLIVAIGGGATTDLAGFVASIWMRGIDWIAVPTTLAGMVDAAIGGKTGINGEKSKNAIGSFHLPIKTIIDLDLLATLPLRDIHAGLAEVIKCGLIADQRILDLAQSIERLDPKDVPSNKVLAEMVKRAVRVKERIVEEDLKEGGPRAFLNYGHTLGHAVERTMNFSLRHGEAVAIGMVFAACLAQEIRGSSDDLLQTHLTLLRKFDLPVSLPHLGVDSLIDTMWRDKKVKSGMLRFVLLESIGNPILREVDQSEVRRSFQLHLGIAERKR